MCSIRPHVIFAAATIALLLPAFSVHADEQDPIDSRLDACLSSDQGQTTAGMVACTGAAISAWDGKLNETYQKALAALDPKSRELLRTAQRQWLAFRAAEHAAQSGPWMSDRGSLMRVEIMGADLSAIKERVVELRLYSSED